jgi:hypothetical protein
MPTPVVQKNLNGKWQINSQFGLIVFLWVLLLRIAHGQLLVENGNSLGAFNFNGTVINPAFISGLAVPQGIVISGNYVFVVNHNIGHVANHNNGTIGEYNLDGTVVNASLISGLTNGPEGIAISGTNLFVASYGSGVGKYSTSGAVINPTLISLGADGIAVSGTNLYVANNAGKIGKYNFDGTVVKASLISGLSLPAGIAISGTNLFVPNFGNGKIGEYGLDGSTINASLISGLSGPNGIAINGDVLYVLNGGNGTVGVYGLDGTVINSSLISGLTNNAPNYGILIMPPPAIQNGDGSFGVQTNVFGFNITGISNQTVSVQACFNLNTSGWVSLQTNVISAGFLYFSDPGWTNYPSRFYRVCAQ